MNILQQHQIIRCQLLTNVNLGTATGKVTLDRPTQLDAYTGLPFIPNSALRGVLKSVSNPSDAGMAHAFGLPLIDENRNIVQNHPGDFVIGNGDLLALPFQANNGERCWVLPLDNILKYVCLEEMCGISTPISFLAGAFYPRNKNNPAVLTFHPLPALPLPVPLKAIDHDEYKNDVRNLLGLLDRWFGDWIPADDPVLLVDVETARLLWQFGTEVRTLTALDQERKAAKGKSLRTLETVAGASIFLSLVTWVGEGKLSFADEPLQIGSREGIGLGFSRLGNVPSSVETKVDATPPTTQSPPDAEQETDADSMANCYIAIGDLKTSTDLDLRKKIRSTINQFGMRVHMQGLQAALAFEMAKAKLRQPDRRNDNRSHSLFLAKLFHVDEDDITSLYGEWMEKAARTEFKELVLQRWRWLRRFTEIDFTT